MLKAAHLGGHQTLEKKNNFLCEGTKLKTAMRPRYLRRIPTICFLSLQSGSALVQQIRNSHSFTEKVYCTYSVALHVQYRHY